MNRSYAVVPLCLVFAFSCASQPTPTQEKSPGNSKGFSYTAKLIDGQVYLQLNANPDLDGRIGPFVKQPDGNYVCETESQGTHSLSRSSRGEWWYGWNYIAMRARLVDASVSGKQEQKQP